VWEEDVSCFFPIIHFGADVYKEVKMDNLTEQMYDVSNPLDLMLEERVRAAFLVQRKRNLEEISAPTETGNQVRVNY
jgi:hypothetical protein